MQPTVVVLEGSIAVGKTTLIELLQEKLEKTGKTVAVIDEPVEDELTLKILKKFYENPVAYGYTFQSYIFSRRVQNAIEIFEKNKNVDVILMERSWLSDPVFVGVNKQIGNINEVEFDCYIQWYSFHERLIPFKIDKIVYLNCKEQTSLERIFERKRPGEEMVELEYLQVLTETYERHMESYSIPRMNVNTETEFSHEEILSFILDSYK